MDKLGTKKKMLFCYSILETTKKGFIKKVTEVNLQKKCIIELRLDYLLYGGMTIEEIVKLINLVKLKYTNKKLIATIRTFDEGGKVDLPKEKYFYYIKALYLETKVTAIDVEYKFYKIDREYYDSLFKKKKKDIILSIHLFNTMLYEGDYQKIFEEMANTSGNIIKFAIKIYTKADLFSFMAMARKSYSMLKKQDKRAVFIAMGEVGKLSRIWPEYTYTKIVFLSAYDNENNGENDKGKELGQFSKNVYLKYRKLLAKKSKN